MSGKTIDGYMSGIEICFDNGQGACDPTLPTTTTDAQGNYMVNVLGDATGKHLLAVVLLGTLDMTTKTTFRQGFILLVVVSGANQNVTPLTSMTSTTIPTSTSTGDRSFCP
ncbi:hypothetical protein [Ralstonia insidiosa]|uniref:Uncharacterized protein n=1 Tax=Ralstonia insidiosa TaxID=190721 RepID=A0A848NY51_9RALS|nr:hypothetical protein [Ralstonia insidiosa]NMV37873.1 hypothetical protein [Ralstonia insidiosa]